MVVQLVIRIILFSHIEYSWPQLYSHETDLLRKLYDQQKHDTSIYNSLGGQTASKLSAATFSYARSGKTLNNARKGKSLLIWKCQIPNYSLLKGVIEPKLIQILPTRRPNKILHIMITARFSWYTAAERLWTAVVYLFQLLVWSVATQADITHHFKFLVEIFAQSLKNFFDLKLLVPRAHWQQENKSYNNLILKSKLRIIIY